MERTTGLVTPIGISGCCVILVHSADTGQLQRIIRTHNLFVNDGLAFLIDRAKGDQFNIANYFAVGNNTSPVAATQQTLLSEKFRAQISTSRRIGNNQWEVRGFVGSAQANGETLQEFGIFANPNTDGTPMLVRLIHSPIVKNSSSTVTYIWTGTFAAL